jgi:hypothetical protein
MWTRWAWEWRAGMSEAARRREENSRAMLAKRTPRKREREERVRREEAGRRLRLG